MMFNRYALKRTISGLGNIKNGHYLYENYIKYKKQELLKRMTVCPWPPKKYHQKRIDLASRLKENNPPPSSQKN